MANADEGRVVSTCIEGSFKVAPMCKWHPANHTCDPVVRPGIGEQCLVFRQCVRRFNRYRPVDPGRFELRRQIVRLKRTSQRLKRRIANMTFPRKSGHRVTRIWPLPVVG